MPKLIIELETVTPLFLGGAVSQKPELRAPSIRGQLRYWLRAALGGLVGDDLAALKQAESDVFGSTEGAGAITVRARWLKPQAPQPVEENTLPHPSSKRPAKVMGFPAGSRFQVQLTQRSVNKNTWIAAVAALLLMVSFGGLGKRCRRGWGTVRITKVDASQANLPEGWREILDPRPYLREAWLGYCNDCLEAAQVGIKSLLPQSNIQPVVVGPPTAYTIASPNLVKPMVIGKIYDTYTDAISAFGEAEHRWLQSNPARADSVGFAKGQKRQASPLWLRVFPVDRSGGATGYILIATLFNIAFQGANYNAVENFLKTTKFEVPR